MQGAGVTGAEDEDEDEDQALIQLPFFRINFPEEARKADAIILSI